MCFERFYNNSREKTHSWQAKHFQLILKLLADLKITPNQITAFRLIFVLPFAYYFFTKNIWGALIIYLVFWLLDLFDGSLARYLKIENDQGAFLDSLIDNFMYSFLILGIIYWQAADVLILAYNILIQLTTQVLATIKKNENKESNWLIQVKPNVPYFKTFAHIFLLLLILNINFLNPVFLALNIWMTLASLYYFFIIKNRKQNNASN